MGLKGMGAARGRSEGMGAVRGEGMGAVRGEEVGMRRSEEGIICSPLPIYLTPFTPDTQVQERETHSFHSWR